MRKTYPPEVRAEAIAAILTGESVNAVAKRLGVSWPTLRRWQSELSEQTKSTLVEQKRNELGARVYSYLLKTLTALEAQTEKFADKEWLDRQSAEGVAILHGVMVDKTVRLLSALREHGDAEV